jgi:hypothetical protein
MKNKAHHYFHYLLNLYLLISLLGFTPLPVDAHGSLPEKSASDTFESLANTLNTQTFVSPFKVESQVTHGYNTTYHGGDSNGKFLTNRVDLHALDIQPTNSKYRIGTEVVAVTDATVWHKDNCGVVLRAGETYIGYMHITANPNLNKNDNVIAGKTIIGSLTTCWIQNGAILHLEFLKWGGTGEAPRNAFPGNFPWYSIPFPDLCGQTFPYSEDKEHYQNQGKKIPVCEPTPPCPGPSINKITLYKNAGFNCGEQGEGSGFGQFLPGLYNIPAQLNNQASSIRIPSGWSVKLYDGNDRQWGWSCRKGDDDDFTGDIFNNVTSLNDAVSSIEVWNNPTCGSELPPDPPVLVSPPYGYTAHDGKAPQLCWTGFDPNGDSLTYNVAINVGDTQLAQTNTTETCWTPSNLNNLGGFGYWEVTANDGKSGSATSQSRKISIGNPPSIKFDSANKDSFQSGTVTSSKQDWIFTGTASDPDSSLKEIKMACFGDGCGSQAEHSGNTSWNHKQTGLSGKNYIFFVAYSNDDDFAISRTLFLNIDLAAPSTIATFNDEKNPSNLSKWFTTPVQIKLQANDNGTGNATAGMGQIFYRLDGGALQSQNTDNVSLVVNTDGYHTLDYYAVDAVGNQESSHSVAFKLDQTAPSWPVNITETHLTVSGEWQNKNNIPAFTWAPVSDPVSGLSGYQFYFGPDPLGIGYEDIFATQPPIYTPYPAGVHTGEYYLRGRVQDIAGNWSLWANLFTFRYDNTSPENPTNITHTAGINTDWQNTSNLADFSWTSPHDEGSGIQGYYVYWGTDETATATTLITNNTLKDTSPLCAANAACTGYLRLRSMDKVNNPAEEWTTAFVLRYDNAPPTVDFTFNGGITTTSQSQIMLDIHAQDEGSGVKAVRFSSDGIKWGDWEAPAAQRPWVITPISRQTWSVYVQCKDRVGLLSEVVRHDIYFDVNAGQPHSNVYRLFDYTTNSGSSKYQSSHYSGRGLLGQVLDSPAANSPHYQLSNGFEAASQAIPLVTPSHDVFKYINSVFASGIVFDTTKSPSYKLIFSQGEIGLPENETLLTSSNYQYKPGFLAAAPSGLVFPKPPTMPGPSADPNLKCQTPSIQINNGAAYTNIAKVTLNICAPYAVEMKISNYEDLSGAGWETFAESKSWWVPTSGANTIPRYVYAAFREANGRVQSVYFDDILYDPQTPSGQLLLTDSILPQAQNPDTGQMLALADASTVRNDWNPLLLDFRVQIKIGP